MKVKSESEVAQSYLTLSNSIDCSLPGSSIHGIFQARVLEWGAIAFSDHREMECKSRKSRDTWSNSQVWPWSTKGSREMANGVLPRECTDHNKHPLPTTQDSTHGHHQMVNIEIRLIIFSAAKDGEALYSQQKQDWELTVALRA